MNDESEVSLLLMIRVWSPRLTEREIPRTSHQLVKNVKSFYQIKHVGLRTDKVVSALSRASLYRDEARRGVSVATAPCACWEPRAESSENQVLPMTADTCRVSVERWMLAAPGCNPTDLALAAFLDFQWQKQAWFFQYDFKNLFRARSEGKKGSPGKEVHQTIRPRNGSPPAFLSYYPS